MANGLVNPFAPTRQAMQNFRQTIPAMAQMERQRQLNKLKQMNQLAEQQKTRRKTRQQQQMQQGMQQYRQGVAQEQQDVQGRNLFRALSYGQEGQEGPTAQMNQLAAPQSQQIEEEPQYAPAAAEIEMLRQQGRMEEAQSRFGEYLNQFKEMADVAPEQAEQFWEQNFGEQVSVRGDDEVGKIIEGEVGGEMRQFRLMPDGQLEQLEFEGQPLGAGEEEDLSDEARDEQRIRSIFPNLSDEWIEAYVQGKTKVSENAMGRPILVNEFTGESKPITPEQVQQIGGDQAQPTPTKQKEEEISTPAYEEVFKITPETGQEATGFYSNLRQFTNNLSGMVPGVGMPFENTADARNKVQMMNQAIKKAVALNESRPSRYEQEMIQQFLPDTNALIKNPEESRQQLFNLYNFVDRRIKAKRNTIEEGRTSAKEERELQKEINTFSDIQGMFGDQFKRNLTEQMGEGETGITIQEIENMPLNQLQNRIDATQLSEEKKDALEKRLNQEEGR